jgi:hypothetical protein
MTRLQSSYATESRLSDSKKLENEGWETFRFSAATVNKALSVPEDWLSPQQARIRRKIIFFGALHILHNMHEVSFSSNGVPENYPKKALDCSVRSHRNRGGCTRILRQLSRRKCWYVALFYCSTSSSSQFVITKAELFLFMNRCCLFS